VMLQGEPEDDKPKIWQPKSAGRGKKRVGK